MKIKNSKAKYQKANPKGKYQKAQKQALSADQSILIFL